MTPRDLTFRVFVSSTFSDLVGERNALQQQVFPRLREFCQARGARFQAIDLRWGVSEEAALDQQTMNICLEELRRCQRITPRPNFIILLGQRYGWCPLPPQIDAAELDQLLAFLPEDGQQRLRRWYRRDDNAVPAEYQLQPRAGRFHDGATWAGEERELRALLRDAITQAGWAATDPRRLKYEASATHQEILHGALSPQLAAHGDSRDHVFGFFRAIEGLPHDATARHYLDLDGHGRPDAEARGRLDRLQAEMRARLFNNIQTYPATWTGSGPSHDHLAPLCADVYDRLSGVIEEQVRRRDDADPLEAEATAHRAFGQERTQHFTGREEVLARIREYLQADNRYPLVVHGLSGMGKSALMARAAQLGGPEAVARFVGATPASCDPRTLLAGICREIGRRYGCDVTSPADYASLVEEFGKRLSLATAQRPLVIVVDGLDQLRGADPERGLLWLPAPLPEHVKLVVSVESGDSLSAIRARVPAALLAEVTAMPSRDAEVLLDRWLGEARRTLQPEQRREVLGKFAGCPRPLYLRLAFEEARRWRSFDRISEATGGEGLGLDLGGILEGLFTRLARPEQHGAVLVARTVSALAAASDGLTEDELLDVLSDDPEVLQDFHHHFPRSPDVPRLPVVAWSRLQADLEPYLSRRVADESLVLSLQPGPITQTARALYLRGGDAIRTHGRLAGYFQANGDPAGDGTWAGSPRSVAQAPYHLYQARLLPELTATLASDHFARRLCAGFGQQALLDALELGLAAAREQHSVRYASAVLIAWGRALDSEGANARALISHLLSAGRVREASDLLVALPPADASEGLLCWIHTAMDRGQHAIAGQLLPALLAVAGALPEETMRARLRVVDRLAAVGHWAALRLLGDPRPEDAAVRILVFMAGTTRFNERMAEELGEVVGTLGDPYWRGVCQLTLCTRLIRADLPGAKAATDRLRNTLKACADGRRGVELSIMAARLYRWLRLGGFRPDDLADPELIGIELHDGSPLASRAASAPPGEGRLEGSFAFVPERSERRRTPEAGEFAEAMRRALGSLAGCGASWSLEPALQARVQAGLRAAEAGAMGDHGELLWWSLMPAVARGEGSKAGSGQIALRRLAHARRLEVMLSLLRLGREDEVISLVHDWSASDLNRAEQGEVFNTLSECPRTPVTRRIVEAAADRIGSALSTPSRSTMAAMAGCLLRHGLVKRSVYWLDRLRSIVAPSMALNLDQRPQPETLRSYLLLSLTMPPRSGESGPEELRNAARRHALRLAEAHPRLADLLCQEFGLREPPLSYLADRLLAFWGEEAAWIMSADQGLRYLEGLLKPDVVNDDRERFRSWFFWLLVLSRAPDAAQMDAWHRHVRSTGGQRLRHEVALLRALGSGDSGDTGTPAVATDRNLGAFAAVARIANRELHDAAPQMLAYWGDAALRFSDDPADQAAGMAFLAEASVRMGQEEVAETYLATAGALDEGVLPWARERVKVARVCMDSSVVGVVDALRHWNSPRTFREAWQGVVSVWRDAANYHGLLALTEFLRRVPDGWDELLAALCHTTPHADDAPAIAGLLVTPWATTGNPNQRKGV